MSSDPARFIAALSSRWRSRFSPSRKSEHLRRGALGEQFQQDAQTVVAFNPEVSFELVVHRRPELAVEHDRCDSAGIDAGLDLLEFPAADERPPVRTVPALDDGLDDSMARGRQQGGDLSDIDRQRDEEDIQRSSEGVRSP